MAIKINNVILGINEDVESVKTKALGKLGINENKVKEFKILRESIDARRKTEIKFNYTVEIKCENEEKLVNRQKNKDITIEPDTKTDEIKYGLEILNSRPIIVGMGPAGLFAALLLSQNGYNPIIIERGDKVEIRDEKIKKFWKDKILDSNSNIQFGEGGAGTYSDGKLTTRIKDTRCDWVLETLVKHGATKEIIYSGKPHIGTDILRNVVIDLRNEILKYGGEIRYNSLLDNINIYDGKVKSISVNKEEIQCENIILAIGHSSRDTYNMLFEKGIAMEYKPFSVGFRIEHPQSMIDESQYGNFAGHKRLKAADYKLTYNDKKDNRGVYSFCMCPGGVVVNASSEENKLVVNGMSYYTRKGINANSAIVATVNKEDMHGDHPLCGIQFQRELEEKAFIMGGSSYRAPVQLLGDFMEEKISKKIGEVRPTITSGYELTDMSSSFPQGIKKSIQEGLKDFGRKIKGFDRKDAILTGFETRTSAPLRIIRKENLEALLQRGIFPCGEGAGYAGGIISAAVDGIKCAEKFMEKYKPK